LGTDLLHLRGIEKTTVGIDGVGAFHEIVLSGIILAYLV